MVLGMPFARPGIQRYCLVVSFSLRTEPRVSRFIVQEALRV